MASPIAWEHHYGIMVSIYACVLALLMGAWPGKRGLIFVAFSFVLASNIFLFTNLAANSRGNFVQSYLLAAAGLLVFSMVRYAAATETRPVNAG
jgi:alpha-1,2-mannosyltransferase